MKLQLRETIDTACILNSRRLREGGVATPLQRKKHIGGGGVKRKGSKERVKSRVYYRSMIESETFPSTKECCPGLSVLPRKWYFEWVTFELFKSNVQARIIRELIKWNHIHRWALLHDDVNNILFKRIWGLYLSRSHVDKVIVVKFSFELKEKL